MNDETIRAILTFLGGGVMLGLIQQFGKRSDMTFADKVAQRGEQITELDKLRARIEHLENQIDLWQKRYYEQSVITERLAGEHKMCTDRADRQEEKIKSLQAQIDALAAGGPHG